MSRWIAMFDRSGLDMLVPCDEIMTRDALQWLGGQNYTGELAHHLSVAKMRAMANPQRFPEIWVYDCEFDSTPEQMRDMWDDAPQNMADLVRKKGTCIYKTPREKDLIV
jgi:hypothetical protein